MYLRTNKLQKLSKVAYENNEKRLDSVYSKRIRAGKRRTYFFDVRATRGNDYYITITESRKKFNEDGYDRHKIFLYKEDFNKFLKALTEAVDFVKTDLMPDFDFDAFNHIPEDIDVFTVSTTFLLKNTKVLTLFHKRIDSDLLKKGLNCKTESRSLKGNTTHRKVPST